MNLKQSFFAFAAWLFFERPAGKRSLAAHAEALRQSGQEIDHRLAALTPTPAHHEGLRHVVGIERWGQRRLRVFLGEPLVMDGHHPYKPDAAADWAALRRAFDETRAETIRLAGRLADGLGVRPRVTVDSQVVSEQTREVLELATVERRLRVQHTYTHTWLGSTKQIRLTGTYLAKAGFDLSEGFEVEVESAPGEEAPRITVRAGEPKLLSIELQDVQVAEDEGLWNRIQPAERQRSLNALQQVARRQAERSGILDAAQQSFERQVQQILLDRLAPTRFELGTEPPPEMRLP